MTHPTDTGMFPAETLMQRLIARGQPAAGDLIEVKVAERSGELAEARPIATLAGLRVGM
jgi:hypothetical protein